MIREVKPELLDELPPDNPRAIRSRKDLRRVNVCMGQAGIMAQALAAAFADRTPRTIVDLGAGDGTPLLRVAKALGPRYKSVRAVLVDRQRLLSPETVAEFESLSWRVEVAQGDIFEWFERPNAAVADATVTGLFLHHFKEESLRRLLHHAAGQTNLFLACEPRRAGFPLLGASLLGFIGCNDVTRHDAKASVRAGFAEKEISTLWPVNGGDWRLRETSAGLFSHCFVAQRVNGDVS